MSSILMGNADEFFQLEDTQVFFLLFYIIYVYMHAMYVYDFMYLVASQIGIRQWYFVFKPN